jgi:hypothetical protein
MARAARGRKHSPETKAKIAAARLGRRHTPETIAKITAKRRARRAETVEECRARNERQWRATSKAQHRQWKLDVATAYRIGDQALLMDVVRSRGAWEYRKIHHPEVSDGERDGTIVWGFPRNLEERKRIGLIKGFIRTNRKRARREGLQAAG